MSERLSLGLRLAASGMIGEKVPELTLRQLAILDLSACGEERKTTVKGMAASLNVSKPAVTRGADRLAALGFIRRRTLEDRRIVAIEATEKGLSELAKMVRVLGES